MAGESAGRRRAEALVNEVLPPTSEPRPGWVRVVATARDLVAGLAETGSLEALQVQRWISTAVRRPQPQHRIVAVVAGKGGVGASTTAWAVATILATLRDDTTAVVSLRPDPARRWPAGIEGLEAVDLITDAPSANDVFDLVDRLSNRHAFTVLDVGNDASAIAQAALLCADRAIVVTGTGPESIEHARLALRRTRDGRTADAIVEPVVAAVRTRPGSDERAARSLTQQLGLSADGLVRVPYDRELARCARVGPALPSRSAQAAFVTLAALVAAGPTGQPSR